MRTSISCLAIALCMSCSHSHPSTTSTSPTTTGAGAGSASGSRLAGTGVLGEDQFKALHQLRGDHSPAPTGQMIDLAGGKAYLSLPANATGPVPGIVVIHEWWGLNEHIEHWADRLAALGYAALAVDLYDGKTATTPDDAMRLMKSVDDKRAHAILSAAVDFLSTDPRIKAPRRAVIGWCFGGGWSLQTALDHPDLDAIVMYYGMPETDPKALAPIRGELLGIFANKDTFITPAIVDTFETALTQAGVRATIKRYDADHAFANPSGPHYDEPAAADAWQHVVEFLGRTLGGRTSLRAPAAAPAAATRTASAPRACHTM